jgi:hypothetical protein
MENGKNWQNRALLIGGIAGAFLGVLAAYLMIITSEGKQIPKLTTQKSMRLIMGLTSVLKSFAKIANEK